MGERLGAVAGLDDHDLRRHHRPHQEDLCQGFAMKVAGHYDVVPSRNIWGRVAAELRIDQRQALARVRELTEKAARCARVLDAEPLPPR